MIASLLPMLAALGLLGAASRRAADQLCLTQRQRRQAKGAGWVLLAFSFAMAGRGLIDAIAWVMALGMIVPPVALGYTLFARRR